MVDGAARAVVPNVNAYTPRNWHLVFDVPDNYCRNGLAMRRTLHAVHKMSKALGGKLLSFQTSVPATKQ